MIKFSKDLGVTKATLWNFYIEFYKRGSLNFVGYVIKYRTKCSKLLK